MRPRLLVFITLLALCHLEVGGQTLTNGLPSASPDSAGTPSIPDDSGGNASGASASAPDAASSPALPEDPGQEILPVAQPEPEAETGVPVHWEAQRQTRVGDDWTLSGEVVVHYRDYVLSADKVVFHQSTSDLEGDGHLQVTGGPEDVLINATRGEMRLKMHTARFFNVTGTMGVRTAGRSNVYSTTNPFRFSGRILLQTGEGSYRIVDGNMTNCRLPKPDWTLISHSIEVADGKASTTNAVFKLFGMPVFYLPYLRHPVDETGRESGFLIPIFPSNYSSIRGYTFGEQFYWAINRNMDMIVGTDYYSKRGWAPNGDFRYRGPGLDHLTMRWNSLFDRGIEETVAATATQPATTQLVRQGGVDLVAEGRQDLTDETRVAGNVEYLSSYVYRLVFNDNYSLATSSEVTSNVSFTHAHNGFVPSVSLDRFQSFASSNTGDEVRLIHLPSLRYDLLDRPLGNSPIYIGLGSSLGYLNRSEPRFHARNLGRLDLYPHLSMPISAGGWSLTPEVALRNTFYSESQNPDLSGERDGIPTIRHELLDRVDAEASVDLRAPAIERDFSLTRWNRVLRHVIEPEFTYRFVGGIGNKARNAVRIDTADIASDTNEAGVSLTQRLYVRSTAEKLCVPDAGAASDLCPAAPREWASWQIVQKVFLNPSFGGALISGRRNVFDSTLDLSGVAFLTSNRNLAPVTSRLRFEAIENLRIEWDLDYDPKAGHIGANNLFAGYSMGRTTVGVGHALLNAVDENGSMASTVQSQQVQPFITIGKQSGGGFNLAANGGYDFVLGQLQYAGVEATYNWDCCGLTVGYKRLDLGAIRGNDTQYLYSFTLANFGTVPGISRSKSVFRDPSLPPVY